MKNIREKAREHFVECSAVMSEAAYIEMLDLVVTFVESLSMEAAPKPGINGDPSPYLVHCEKDDNFGSCGESSYLTPEQYDAQMLNPDKPWRCPQCGCYPCRFDDENFEKATDDEIKTPLFSI